MRKSTVLSVLFAICLMCIAYAFMGSYDARTAIASAPVVSSFAVSPDIPAEMKFCDERVDLLRYNIREGLDRELTSFTYMHSSTLLAIKRANRYFPIIEPILKKNGIPDDFKYLAVIESNLDPNAVSPARAIGMWQFMESAARQYGLRITSTVDERRNVILATEAACRYLKDAYRKYGNWINVAASYNAGMGRISGQLERQGENSVFHLHLIDETSCYPYRLIAVKQIFENPYKYGYVLKAENLHAPIACTEMHVSTDIPDLIAFAQKNNITYLDLKFFNPWLRDTKLETKGGTYTLLIPDGNMLFYDKSDRYVHDRRWIVN